MCDPRLARHECNHLACTWQLLHQPTAGRNELEAIFQAENSSCVGRHVFTNAVADDKLRMDTPTFPKFIKSIFDGEQRGLCVSSLIER